MGCGSGGCSTGGGCSGGCSSGGCNKLNTYDWLAEMELPPHMKPFDIVEVQFKGTRKEFYRAQNLNDFFVNEYVVVEVENGYDIGKVNLKGELVKLQLKKYNRSEHDTDFKKILRKANEADIAKHKENKELEIPTMYKARSFAMELGLSMKLSDVEYQGDRRKATFYYTAEERVDFRELIKKLADSFKVRIEMRQIGYRQEAGRLGGIGSCGRELCCSTWLTDFKLVNTNAARYQNLSLNPLKLSGQCGKLKCCLNFELDSYLEALKEFPDENNISLTFEDNRVYKQVKTDILKRVMWFAPFTEIGGEWINLPVSEVRNIKELNKKGEFPPLLVQDKKQAKTDKATELEFKNDMGTGSLTRLDDRDRKKKGKGFHKPQHQQRSQNNQRPQQEKPNFEKPQGPRPTTEKPQDNRNRPPQNQPRNNRPNKPNFQNNRNKPKPENPS
jgi:cell fate regulator YaaT (PSP1 superfamily)